jgi:hypothetical protein
MVVAGAMQKGENLAADLGDARSPLIDEGDAGLPAGEIVELVLLEERHQDFLRLGIERGLSLISRMSSTVAPPTKSKFSSGCS